MSFREKSAWLMAALMLGAGGYYLVQTLGAPAGVRSAGPLDALLPLTFIVVAGSVAAQTALALLAPKHAAAPADERERPLLDRAGRWSGLLLGAGVACSVLYFFVHGDGVVLFHTVMASLILSQLGEYLFQIALFRRHA